MDIYNNQDFLDLFYTKCDFSVDFFAETFDLDDTDRDGHKYSFEDGKLIHREDCAECLRESAAPS